MRHVNYRGNHFGQKYLGIPNGEHRISEDQLKLALQNPLIGYHLTSVYS